jgi:hypothetical protein
MSDPKAGLVPAKKKLIEINLGRAGAVVNDVFTDIVAKTTAEMLEPQLREHISGTPGCCSGLVSVARGTAD